MKPIYPMDNGNLPPSPAYTSRIYSLVKRLAWGLFFNGIGALFLLRVSEERPFSGIVREKHIGVFILVQLAVVPILLALWALVKPRRYTEWRSLWILPVFVPLFMIDFFLMEAAYVFACWAIWPPQFAR